MTFILIVLYLPIVGFLIYSAIHPEETFMIGRKWQFKDGVEPTEEAIAFHKWGSIIALIVITLVFGINLLYELLGIG